MEQPTGLTNLFVGLQGAGLTAAGIALGIAGTMFFSGNNVSTQQYTTSRLLNNTIAYDVTTQTGSTATGGLASTNGNYQAITIASPMSATNAPLNGLNVGSGALTSIQLDIVNPGLSTAITCSIAGVSTRGTGGTIVVPRRSTVTGSVILFATATGNLVPTIGPTQSLRCSVSPAPGTNFSVKATAKIAPSQVIN